MSKPCLRLINCAGNAQRALSHKRRREGFQLIQGGAIVKYPPITSDAFHLMDAHLHISYEYYLALLLAGLAVISWAAPRHIEPLPRPAHG